MDKFEIGEIAALVGGFSSDDSYFDGEEVEILSGPQEPLRVQAKPGVVYYLVNYRGTKKFARREMLRKKKPPSREIDQVTTWDNFREATGWHPAVMA